MIWYKEGEVVSEQAADNSRWISHCLDLKWDEHSQMTQCSSMCNPIAQLHTCALVDLGHNISMMGRFVLSAEGFHLCQLHIHRVFCNVIAVLLSPVGPRFTDVIEQNRVISGEQCRLK